MKRRLIFIVIIIVLILLLGYLILIYLDSPGDLSKTKHESNVWAVIEDSKKDIIAVETTNSDVWETLVDLHQNQSEMWIGGIIEEYDNYWGFRFDPDTIIIAEITIEGAQSNIQGISGDLNYWINVWTKQAYVLAKVIEIHE